MAAAKRTQAQWRRLVAEFEASDMTQRAFARSKGVTVASLQGWLYRIRRETNSPRFVEVVRGHTGAGLRPKAVVTVERARIEFGERPPAEYLAALVRAIGEARG